MFQRWKPHLVKWQEGWQVARACSEDNTTITYNRVWEAENIRRNWGVIQRDSDVKCLSGCKWKLLRSVRIKLHHTQCKCVRVRGWRRTGFSLLSCPTRTKILPSCPRLTERLPSCRVPVMLSFYSSKSTGKNVLIWIKVKRYAKWPHSIDLTRKKDKTSNKLISSTFNFFTWPLVQIITCPLTLCVPL